MKTEQLIDPYLISQALEDLEFRFVVAVEAVEALHLYGLRPETLRSNGVKQSTFSGRSQLKN